MSKNDQVMDPDAYEQELLDMGADPEDANAADQDMRRRQRDERGR